MATHDHHRAGDTEKQNIVPTLQELLIQSWRNIGKEKEEVLLSTELYKT